MVELKVDSIAEALGLESLSKTPLEIKVADNTVSFSTEGDDYHMEVVADCQGDTKFNVRVPLAVFQSVLSTVDKNESIKLSPKKNYLEVKAGSSKSRIATVDEELREYGGHLLDLEYELIAKVSANELNEGIKRCFYARNKDRIAGWVFRNLLIEASDNMVFLAASDSYRMSTYKIEAEILKPARLLVRGELIGALGKVVRRLNDTILLYSSTASLRLISSNSALSVATSEGVYPNVKALMEGHKNGQEIKLLEPAQLKSALIRAKAFQGKEAAVSKCHVLGNTMTVVTEGAWGSHEEELPLVGEHPEIFFDVTSNFLSEPLAQMKSFSLSVGGDMVTLKDGANLYMFAQRRR